MIARIIKGFTHRFGKPDNWQGQCDTLAVRMNNDSNGVMYCESAWYPTPEELEQINSGSSIVIRIYAIQPVIATYVEETNELRSA